MFEWLFVLLAPVFSDAAPPQKDYVGVVAAEAAYSALLSGSTPVNPAPVDPKNCPTCRGTGRVRTGDDQNWTKCPTCQPMTSPGQLPSMKLQVRPLTPPKTSNCPNGMCPQRRA